MHLNTEHDKDYSRTSSTHKVAKIFHKKWEERRSTMSKSGHSEPQPEKKISRIEIHSREKGKSSQSSIERTHLGNSRKYRKQSNLREKAERIAW